MSAATKYVSYHQQKYHSGYQILCISSMDFPQQIYLGCCIRYCSIILRVNNEREREYLTLVWAIKNERVKIIGFISKIMHIMGVLIRGLLTHLVEKTSTRQCCVLWDYCVVVMAESQEQSSEIADKVVNEDASTLTCLCC